MSDPYVKILMQEMEISKLEECNDNLQQELWAGRLVVEALLKGLAYVLMTGAQSKDEKMRRACYQALDQLPMRPSAKVEFLKKMRGEDR